MSQPILKKDRHKTANVLSALFVIPFQAKNIYLHNEEDENRR